MRTATLVLLAGFTLGVLTPAQAADLDYGVLRGPDYEPEVPLIDWGGVYFGGHGGYTSAALAQKSVAQTVLADHFKARDIESQFNVSSLLVLPSTRTEGASFGAYAGFNYQFDEAVVGIEVDYTRFDRASTVFNDIARIYSTTAGTSESVYLAGQSSTKIEEYGTIRARGGWAFGNFLPYLTGGLAIGRAHINDQIIVQNYGYDANTYTANQASTTANPNYVYRHGYASFNPNYPGNNSTPSNAGVQTKPDAPSAVLNVSKTKTIAGFALGGGLEYALTQNIILRGEYQYVLFNDFDGHKVNLNTVRGGAAIKF